MTSATMAAAFSGTVAVLPLLLTWRCKNVRCRRFICRLQWDGRTIAEYKCGCDHWTRLPDDAAASLRDDRRKW